MYIMSGLLSTRLLSSLYNRQVLGWGREQRCLDVEGLKQFSRGEETWKQTELKEQKTKPFQAPPRCFRKLVPAKALPKSSFFL